MSYLDESDLKDGMKFLVGTWDVAYVVDTTSEDEDHIPVAEYKEKSGKDYTGITYEFMDDHTLKMKDGATDKEENGTWEQKGYSTFGITVGKFYGDVKEETLDSLQELQRTFMDELVFNFGDLKIAMNKQGGFPDSSSSGGYTCSLDEDDLARGLKFLVGTWDVCRLVDKTTEDNDDITLEQYKEKTGKDYSKITYEFSEDHTVKMKNGVTDQEESGTWEQTGYGAYKVTVGKFYGDVDEDTRKTIESVERNFCDELQFTFGGYEVVMSKEGGFPDGAEPVFKPYTCTLDEDDLLEGKQFLVGTWQVDYIVNAFSNNLDHIPAKEFKSDDGKDFSQITYEFFEDQTMKMKNGATGQEESGTWEQKDRSSFVYTVGKFFGEVEDETFLKNLQTLEKNFEGGLCFSLAFLAFGMKKIADGVVTVPEKPKEVSIGDLVPTEEDLKHKDIVGRWKVYKMFACVGQDIGLFTLDEVKADIEKKKAAGEETDEKDTMLMFGMVLEFKDDYTVASFTALPPNVPKEEIDKAVANGEIKIQDGMMVGEDQRKWKYVNDDYWCSEGDESAPWSRITPGDDGRMDMKMMILEKM